jgi:hypothetical protein
MIVTEFALPLRLDNPLNGSHEHWAAKAKKRRNLRGIVLLTTKPQVYGLRLPAVVTITRIANSSGLDAHDGLPASCKPVVDAIAEALGIDDRDTRVTWRFAQRRGRAYGCEIRIESNADAGELQSA